MSEQPKLEGTPEPWHHVAREFGDHDMETEGGWNPLTTMERVDDAFYIGDWLPVEPVCKEVVALRAKLDETEAALRDLTKHMKVVIPSEIARSMSTTVFLMKERGLWRDPQPKEESDGDA